MTFTDLTIIYFAIGAPFGVYSFFGVRKPITVESVMLLAAKVVLWPPFATVFAFKRLTRTADTTDFDDTYHLDAENDAAVDNIRREIKAELSTNGNRESNRETLEVLERYLGLALALRGFRTARAKMKPELLYATEHPARDLAAKCIYRRNRARLIAHRNRAIADLASQANGQRSVALMLKATAIFGDSDRFSESLKITEIENGDAKTYFENRKVISRWKPELSANERSEFTA